MDAYIEQYQCKHGGVTLHTWTETQGRKEENFYITGVSGTPVASWFREKLHKKHLPDIPDFPESPVIFMHNGAKPELVACAPPPLSPVS